MPDRLRITTNDEFTAASRALMQHDNVVELVAALMRGASSLVDDVDDLDNGTTKEIPAASICIARNAVRHAMQR